MSVATGGTIPDKNDLLLLLGEENPKSWKGKPTVNLGANHGVNGMNGITYTYVSTDEEGWKKYSLSGTWNSGTYPYSAAISNTSMTGGTKYSVAATMKTNVKDKFAGGFTYINYVNAPKDYEGTGGYEILEDGSHRPYKQGFAYTSTTTQLGYLDTRPASNGTTFNSSTDFFYIKDIQVEQSDFRTPYVNGTRSSTSAFTDVSGNDNQVTIGNLSYASDNTFDFDGTDDYIALPNDIGYTNEVSVVAWIKTDGSPGGGYHIVCGGQHLEISIPHSTGELRHGVYTTTGRHVTNRGSGLSDGNWHQVAMTFGGNQLKGYIDGVQAGSTATPSGNLISSFSGRRLGQFGTDSTYWMNGKIASYAVYKKVLSASEILESYNNLKSRYS